MTAPDPPPGFRTWMGWSPRRRWFVGCYLAALLVIPSLVVSVVFRSWPTILTNAIILVFLALGDWRARMAWRDGYNDGVTATLTALTEQSRSGFPDFPEFERLVGHPVPPWRNSVPQVHMAPEPESE